MHQFSHLNSLTQRSNSSKQRPLCLSGAFEFCHKGETAFSPLAFVQSHGSIAVQSEYWRDKLGHTGGKMPGVKREDCYCHPHWWSESLYDMLTLIIMFAWRIFKYNANHRSNKTRREGIISEINQSDLRRQGPWERVSLKLSINSKTTQLGWRQSQLLRQSLLRIIASVILKVIFRSYITLESCLFWHFDILMWTQTERGHKQHKSWHNKHWSSLVQEKKRKKTKIVGAL